MPRKGISKADRRRRCVYGSDLVDKVHQLDDVAGKRRHARAFYEA